MFSGTSQNNILYIRSMLNLSHLGPYENIDIY